MNKINDDTLRTFVGYHLKRSFNVIQSDLIDTLRPFDLRMLTYTALVLIVDNPGLNQSRLSQIMDIERPNLVIIIDELEERELITRESVPTDRRSYALHPTQSGRVLYRETLDAVTQHAWSKKLGAAGKTGISVMAFTSTLAPAGGEKIYCQYYNKPSGKSLFAFQYLRVRG